MKRTFFAGVSLPAMVTAPVHPRTPPAGLVQTILPTPLAVPLPLVFGQRATGELEPGTVTIPGPPAVQYFRGGKRHGKS